MVNSDDLNRFRDEYLKKSIFTNRIYMIMLGISILLLLFVFIPYYLSLEHLNNLEDEKIQFEANLDKFSALNNSMVRYFQTYGHIAEPLIDNDFRNITLRINELILTGNSIYPQCEEILATGEFLKCNIRLMAENEFNYLINNQSKSIITSNFQPNIDSWKITYLPQILNLQDLLYQQYLLAVDSANSISSILQIPENLNKLTKNYFERDLPKIIISIFLSEINTKAGDTLESNQESLRDLLVSFRSNLTQIENDIANTGNLISSITKRIGDIGTPVASVALGFEEILIFSPIILAFFYFIFLYSLIEATRLRRENIPSGDIIGKLNPLIICSTRSKNLRILLVSLPSIIYAIYCALMIAIWARFEPFFIFDAFFWVFAFVYLACGVLIVSTLYRCNRLLITEPPPR